jgi:hypothetical protein
VKNKYYKEFNDYNEGVISRIALMKQLSIASPIFPKLHFKIIDKKIEQLSDPIKSFKWPTDEITLKKLWEVFKSELIKMHNYGYVHGDILIKNMLFDGYRFRLIDHEMSLVVGDNLRVTFPWVATEDLILKEVSQKTDYVCIEATELRLFEYEKYKKYRYKQTNLISSFLESNR